MRDISSLPFIDYRDPAFNADPFVWLAQKAAEAPIASSERGVEILEYNLSRTFLLDRALGTDHGNLVERMGLPDSRALDFKRRMILTQNRGATRKRLRQALTGLIGPAQAGQMRSLIRDVIDDLIAGLPPDQVDLKHCFADLIPAGVFCRWVDRPLTDARFVADMSETVLAIFRRDPDLTPGIVAAYDRLFEYARDRIAQRRAHMGDDFISELVRFQNAGGLSPEELEDFVVMLVEASVDNTAHQIAIAIDRLSSMPQLWKTLGDPDTDVDAIVREVMRLWPRSISTSRTALWDTGFADVALPAGTSVFASFGAVHRQPDVFDDPHTFRADRPGKPMHLNFGGGAFSCLGQFVAGIEVSEAIAALARRFPDLRVETARRDVTPMFQSIQRLDCVLTG